MSGHSRTAYVIALAVAGILVAVAVTWATSQIVSQRIGLSSEPVSAGLRLLPARRHGSETGTTSTPARSVPAATAPATTRSAPVPAAPSTGEAETPPAEAPAREAPARERSGDGGDGASSRDD